MTEKRLANLHRGGNQADISILLVVYSHHIVTTKKKGGLGQYFMTNSPRCSLKEKKVWKVKLLTGKTGRSYENLEIKGFDWLFP